MASTHETEGLTSILAAFPPVQEWSRATIDSLKSAISGRFPQADWRAESEWTQRVICLILAPNGSDWTFQRLKSCSNVEYFSLPLHTIALLTALFYSNLHGEAQPDPDTTGDYDGEDTIGYPIFRVDYTSDEEFALYKTCFEEFLEATFYVPGYQDRDNVTWHWIEDRATLDGTGPGAVQQLYRRLSDDGTLPFDISALWICVMVNRKAIESMLRVYGPPATESLSPLSGSMEIPYLPYLTAVDTSAVDADGDNLHEDGHTDEDSEGTNAEYRGYFKFALQGIFELWSNEQCLAPDEYYPRDGKIWGSIGSNYQAPRGL